MLTVLRITRQVPVTVVIMARIQNHGAIIHGKEIEVTRSRVQL